MLQKLQMKINENQARIRGSHPKGKQLNICAKNKKEYFDALFH